MVLARSVGLDQHALAFSRGFRICGGDLLAGRQAGEHASALVSVPGFHHHWHAKFLGRSPSVVGVDDNPTLWDWHANAGQHGSRQLLVLGNGLGHDWGVVRLGRPDSLELFSPTELQQTPGRQPTDRDAPATGSLGDGPCAWSEPGLKGERTELGCLLVGVEWLPGLGGGRPVEAGPETSFPERWFVEIKDDVKHARPSGRRGDGHGTVEVDHVLEVTGRV